MTFKKGGDAENKKGELRRLDELAILYKCIG